MYSYSSVILKKCALSSYVSLLFFHYFIICISNQFLFFTDLPLIRLLELAVGERGSWIICRSLIFNLLNWKVIGCSSGLVISSLTANFSKLHPLVPQWSSLQANASQFSELVKYLKKYDNSFWLIWGRVLILFNFWRRQYS